MILKAFSFEMAPLPKGRRLKLDVQMFGNGIRMAVYECLRENDLNGMELTANAH